MDGNRRFARKENIPRAEGHKRGFDKLMEVLQWCLEIGVKEVTLYAFSIENYKRSRDEVGALMSLAVTKIIEVVFDQEWFKMSEKNNTSDPQRDKNKYQFNMSKNHFTIFIK